jgi:NAD(P)-dependent dehydrogenase (short-subunit alcohol dehydrogenase family)
MQPSIFITGAASGIGKATAKLFAERGYFVGVFDVNEDGVREVAAALGDDRSVAGRLDVRDRASWRAAVDAFSAKTGGAMDVLFGCAGVLKFASFVDCTAEDADRQIAINVNGVVNGIYASLPLLEASVARGRKPMVLTMSSASAIYGQPEMAVYSATKFFVRGLTEALDVELGAKGIRVADVMPGFVDTPMVQNEAHKPKTMGVFGVKTTAEDVAAIVWKASQSDKLHWTTKLDDHVARRLSGFSGLARMVMRRIAAR